MSIRPRSRAFIHLALMSGALVLVAPQAPRSAPADPVRPTSDQVVELNAMSMDSTRAGEAVKRARAALAAKPDSVYARFLHQTLLRALVTSGAPTADILAEAGQMERIGIGVGPARVSFRLQMADLLIRRGERVNRALEYARAALAECPTTPDGAYARAVCHKYVGRARLALGDAQGAIPDLLEALSAAPDSGETLVSLGHAYEASGRPDQAIDAYVRALGVFPVRDTSAAAPLRALYTKRHGSLDGLDARVTDARRASRQQVALDGRQYFGVAPPWSLPDLSGRTVQSGEFKGQVMVIDFWGSWCGPCRAELPHFQAVFERYRDRGVAFVGINWERANDAESAKKAAREFLESNRFTFPVVLDLGRQAVEAYSIDSFPTVYLVDREGHIRYRNVGFNPDIADILVAQIESLLE